MQKARAKQLLSGMQFTGSQMDEARQAKADQQAAGQEEPVGPEVSVAPYPDAAQPSSSLAGAQGLSVTPESVSGGAAVQQATGGMGRAAGVGGDSPYRVTTQVQQGSVPVESPGEVRMIPRTTTQTQIAPNTLSVAEKAQLLMRQMQEVREAKTAALMQAYREAEAARKQGNSDRMFGAKLDELAIRRQNHLENLREKERNRNRLVNQYDEANVNRIATRFDARAKDLRKRQDMVFTVREAIEEARDNPVMTAPLQASLARLASEVGVLTDKDLDRYGGSQAVRAQLNQFVERKLNGTLTKENLDYMANIADVFERVVEQNLVDAAVPFVRQVTQLKSAETGKPFMTPDQAWNRIHTDPSRYPADKFGGGVGGSAPGVGIPVGKRVTDKQTGKKGTVQADGTVKFDE
jgi:uncharacterized protein YutE (UPF0331/DUF86 family)